MSFRTRHVTCCSCACSIAHREAIACWSSSRWPVVWRHGGASGAPPFSGPAGAAGPSALVIWAIAAVGLFVPLVFTVLELSSRHPDEGGMYVWSKRAFGPFAAFITGWTYWSSNLPYFPGLLYFAAANALFVGGARWQFLADNSTYFIIVSLAG